MRILKSNPSGNYPDKLVVIFGLGMIGSSISRSLTRLDFAVTHQLAMHWTDTAKRLLNLEALKNHFIQRGLRSDQLSIVWSAGNAAFHSNTADTKEEQSVFRQVLDTVMEIKSSTKPRHFDFHFLSSAGGLFEGQLVVDLNSKAQPIRPYGQLKLEQEDILKSEFKPSELALYRPSSVYGPMKQDSRRGLINNLISNSRNERVTTLDAHVMSLRDYVFSHDIGQYVARNILRGLADSQTPAEHFLVSARCSSIFEVVRKIERVLNRKLRVRYDEAFGNNRNITFSHGVLPMGWHPVTLDVGIKQFMFNR